MDTQDNMAIPLEREKGVVLLRFAVQPACTSKVLVLERGTSVHQTKIQSFPSSEGGSEKNGFRRTQHTVSEKRDSETASSSQARNNLLRQSARAYQQLRRS